MRSFFFLVIFLISAMLSKGQDNLHGEYTSTIASDSFSLAIQLNLLPGGVYSMNSAILRSRGKWKAGRKKIILHPDFMAFGCLVQENKKIVLTVHNNSLTWKEKSIKSSHTIIQDRGGKDSIVFTKLALN